MEDFFKFNKMITPLVIQFIFVVGTIILIIVGFNMINEGSSMRRGGESLIYTGWGIIFLGPIVLRIYCEIFVVIFSIFDSMNELKNLLKTTIISDNKLIQEDSPNE